MKQENITITTSHYFKPKKWEVLKIGSSNSWNIVTEISEGDMMGYSLTTTPINLSRWKWIRKFQIWMIGKIFKS